MEKRECTNKYPKPYQKQQRSTNLVLLFTRGRLIPETVLKGDIELDNRYVVPHNLTNLKKYQAHINIEWCCKTSAIKYLFKYITKGVVENPMRDPPPYRLLCTISNSLMLSLAGSLTNKRIATLITRVSNVKRTKRKNLKRSTQASFRVPRQSLGTSPSGRDLVIHYSLCIFDLQKIN